MSPYVTKKPIKLAKVPFLKKMRHFLQKLKKNYFAIKIFVVGSPGVNGTENGGNFLMLGQNFIVKTFAGISIKF